MNAPFFDHVNIVKNINITIIYFITKHNEAQYDYFI